jgi:glycosyltransferase involved in cell wall biosynthesis
VASSLHLAALFDRLGPYHRARLDAAGKKVDVVAIEMASESAEYDWQAVEATGHFRRTTLFPDTKTQAVSARRMQERVAAVLEREGPDVVAIPGWSHFGALAALRWCLQTGTPSVVMSASTAEDAPRVWWREWVKQRVVAHFDAGLVGGTRHRAYLSDLGMDDTNIFLGYDAVDNAHFANGGKNARTEKTERRAQLQLPDRYFLAICRFVAKKNLPRLIEAFSRYRKSTAEPWDLVLLGDGPEHASVEHSIQGEGVEEAVHLPGFKQYEELPTYYGFAGAFVHASTREQWGLVVNEAMAAGLPVLVSDRCGCAPDLVEDGRNGFTFDPHDPSALAGLMARVAHGDVNRADMGAASQKIIEEWGPERFATGLRKAAEAALRSGPPDVSLVDRLLIKALMYR